MTDAIQNRHILKGLLQSGDNGLAVATASVSVTFIKGFKQSVSQRFASLWDQRHRVHAWCSSHASVRIWLSKETFEIDDTFCFVMFRHFVQLNVYLDLVLFLLFCSDSFILICPKEN